MATNHVPVLSVAWTGRRTGSRLRWSVPLYDDRLECLTLSVEWHGIRLGSGVPELRDGSKKIIVSMARTNLLATLPISDYVLRLEMVAEYWSREIAGVRTMAEIHAELLCAFWRNEFTVFGSSGEARARSRRCSMRKGFQARLDGLGVTR